MKQNVRGVRHDFIVTRQERVCFAEHFLVARRPLWGSPDKIRNPPRFYLAYEQRGVANPKPIVQPRGISSAVVADAEEQAHCEE